MLQYIDGKLYETTDGQAAVEMWLQHHKDEQTKGKIKLKEYLLTRRYASQDQCARIDQLLGTQLTAASVRDLSANSFGAWRVIAQQKEWLADFAFCQQVPAELRRTALTSLPVDYEQ
ncbi:hypothetical protein [Lacticaseibacillus zhaodongensis]|uniref:hypothetical protein n=1 Tax=Lacticaseibacillus zhaodongensis TaxID=2668065 RepID=UPI0012D36F28|nr:hypothetical protein [Lacticaseibacillus zhaodongensis]